MKSTESRFNLILLILVDVISIPVDEILLGSTATLSRFEAPLPREQVVTSKEVVAATCSVADLYHAEKPSDKVTNMICE